MTHRTGPILVFLALTLTLSGCNLVWSAVVSLPGAPQPAPAAPQPAASAPRTLAPQFRWNDCPFDPDEYLIEEGEVRCGTLTVTEDRKQNGGRLIQLAVVVVASIAADPAPDPILFLAGGPGGGAINDVEDWLYSPLRDERDIILLDQRGTGYSQPNLACPELADEGYDTELDALEACRDRLRQQWVNLQAYNSAATAADVAELREALGYEQINLFGVSYGSRVALTVLRDAPQGIRSVILDSAYPPEVNGYNEQPLNVL
ncbi:MAG: alpha/beta hydrolase, partial [Chloroflexaceae bacterium]|nr:alpha/beta hydrolase [Chloroflexaceae bacterium]